MASQWHYRRGDDEAVGPVGAEELKSLVRAGKLDAADLVWREDMPDWVTVGRIKQLKELIPGNGQPPSIAPPPPPKAGSLGPAARPAVAVAAQAVADSPPPVPSRAAVPAVPPPGPSGLFELGDAFQVAGKKFFGEALASDDAIYLILRRRRNPWSRRGIHFGLVQWLIANAIESLSDASVTGVPVFTTDKLPQALRGHPGWPKDLAPATRVVVFTKAAIGGRGIFHPSMGRLLKFRVGPQLVVMEHAVLGGDKARAFLEQAGWRVTWGGKPPPEEPGTSGADAAADSGFDAGSDVAPAGGGRRAEAGGNGWSWRPQWRCSRSACGGS